MYVNVAAFTALTIIWIKRLNQGLKKFDGLVIIPLLQVFWTIGSILGGGFYYGEFESMMPSRLIAFFTGVCIILGSVYLMTAAAPASSSLQSSSSSSALQKQTELLLLQQQQQQQQQLLLQEQEDDIEKNNNAHSIDMKIDGMIGDDDIEVEHSKHLLAGEGHYAAGEQVLQLQQEQLPPPLQQQQQQHLAGDNTEDGDILLPTSSRTPPIARRRVTLREASLRLSAHRRSLADLSVHMMKELGAAAKQVNDGAIELITVPIESNFAPLYSPFGVSFAAFDFDAHQLPSASDRPPAESGVSGVSSGIAGAGIGDGNTNTTTTNNNNK